MFSRSQAACVGTRKLLGSDAMWVMVKDGPVIGLAQTSEVFKTSEVYGYHPHCTTTNYCTLGEELECNKNYCTRQNGSYHLNDCASVRRAIILMALPLLIHIASLPNIHDPFIFHPF